MGRGKGEEKEKERRHWSGLHVALQLLDSSAAQLLVDAFPSLVDLTLQRIDDGPGRGGVPLFLQVCGCLAGLLRLLGPRMWANTALSPQDLLYALQRCCHDDSWTGAGPEPETTGFRGVRGLPRVPHPGVVRRALDLVQLLVASASPLEGRLRGLQSTFRATISAPTTPSRASIADAALTFLCQELRALDREFMSTSTKTTM
ncbi:unnamed protein product, partial [Choristocarpus tenellus]